MTVEGRVLRRDGDAAEFMDLIASTPRPPSGADVESLIERFYELPGNAAGGSLHVVLDDGNWERDSVIYSRDWARRERDAAGEAFADLLLTLGDEQLHEYLCNGYDNNGNDYVGEHPCMAEALKRSTVAP